MADPGEGPGGPGPPPYCYTNTPSPPPPPPPPLSQGLDDRVPPLPERLDPPPMIALPVWDSPAICW